MTAKDRSPVLRMGNITTLKTEMNDKHRKKKLQSCLFHSQNPLLKTWEVEDFLIATSEL